MRLSICENYTAEQSKWVETERVKFAAAGLTKEERKLFREFALEPSQTVDDMLRVLERHKSFHDVSKSSMPQQARFALVKAQEKELEAIFPLKGDREFLLQRLKEPAGKLPAAAVSESSAAVTAPAPVAAHVPHTLTIPPSSPATPAAAPSVEAVVRVWMRDEDAPNCCICRASFSFFRRRHHCRICLRVICSDCCKKERLAPDSRGAVVVSAEPVLCCSQCIQVRK